MIQFRASAKWAMPNSRPARKGQRAKIDFSAQSVAADEVPGVVHAFVNAVVGYYTGDPGVFGQQIAFVRRDRKSVV